MNTLEDYRPTQAETEMTSQMPEQVAIGFIRAKRRDDLKRVKDMITGDK